MSIVTLSDALIQKLPVTSGRILRDRTLCGLCLKVGKRTRTFFIATSVSGQQFRLTIGRWPLVSVDEARNMALPILRDCRLGKIPIKFVEPNLPNLEAAVIDYCNIKKLKEASKDRYLSALRTHFESWQHVSVKRLKDAEFSSHCAKFAQSNGAAVVGLGRGLIGALIKYINATYALSIDNPFKKLADAGLMPAPAKPRARKLLEKDLPIWWKAVNSLPEKQRDYLLLIVFTGMRKREAADITPSQIDFDRGILHIPETKSGQPLTLPITALISSILVRRLQSTPDDESIFKGISIDHVPEMAIRAGAPKFMLHDLRKLVATVGTRLDLSDAVKRRILNHAAKRGDTLHRHYVSLSAIDIHAPLTKIQNRLMEYMHQTDEIYESE